MLGNIEKSAFDDPVDNLVGTTIGGKYKIIRLVGSGGMGLVYQAFHEHLQTFVALKILPENGPVSKDQLERFQKEARLASGLSHTNIARIFDYGVDPRPYLVMEFVDGEPLSKLISGKIVPPEALMLSIAIQIADGMNAAHTAGLMHRDLKPSNVMIEKDSNNSKIIDFGLSKEFLNDVKLTRTGETVGSPAYMSPEQCRGESLDARSDIYSLGCLLYESFTGVAPFSAPNMMGSIYKHLETEPPPFKKSRPDLSFSKNIETVVLNCLNKKPEDRYASMLELSTALQEVKNQSSGKIRRLNTNSKRQKKFDTVMSIASVVAVILTLYSVYEYWMALKAPSPINPTFIRQFFKL